MLKIGNFFYFLYIFLAILIGAIAFFCLKNKNQKTKQLALWTLLNINLILHFAKLVIPPYINGLPQTISSITPESICSITIIIFPVVFMLKKCDWLKDFVYFISFYGGIAAILFPFEPISSPALSLDTVRFYLCHTLLTVVPLLAMVFKIHRPNPKNFWLIPLLFILYETIILINEVILSWSKLISVSASEFFSKDVRNISMVFGPASRFKAANFLFEPFVPSAFKSDFWGLTSGGDTFYFPVLWLIFPAAIYLPIFYLLLCLPFQIKLKPKGNGKRRLAGKAT